MINRQNRYGSYLRTCLGLFETTLQLNTMSDHVVFSDIFTLNAVSVIKEDFLIQVTNQTLCSHCYHNFS